MMVTVVNYYQQSKNQLAEGAYLMYNDYTREMTCRDLHLLNQIYSLKHTIVDKVGAT